MAFYLSQVAFTPSPSVTPPPAWTPSTFDWTEPSGAWVRRREDLAAALDLGGFGHGTYSQSPLVILDLPAGTSQATFQTAINNMTIDVIQMAQGSYAYEKTLIAKDRTSRPLLVCPAAGATVTFTGNGSTTEGILYVGSGTASKYITFDGLKADGFTFSGISLSSCGVLELWNTDHCTFKNMTFRGLTRDSFYANQPYKSWLVYIEGNGVNSNLLLDRLTGETPVVNRDISGIQGSTGVGPFSNILITNITLTSYHYAFYDEVPTSNLVLDGWTLTDCNRVSIPASIRFTAVAISGTYKNIHATTSGPVFNQSTGVMTDGGGNSGI